MSEMTNRKANLSGFFFGSSFTFGLKIAGEKNKILVKHGVDVSLCSYQF